MSDLDKPSTKELNEALIHPNYLDHKVEIGSRLPPSIRKTVIKFLREHYDCFAWSNANMTCIDPKIIIHRVRVNPDYPSI